MNTPEPILTFDDALNHSLHALLNERQSLEACLSQYPQYAAELKPLLQTALLSQRLRKPVMSDARVLALEDRLMQAFPAAPAADPVPETPRRAPARSILTFPSWMGRTAAIVVLVLLAALGTGGGTVAASANSVPGETLYSIKRAWEEVILLVASLIGRLEDMRLHLATVRWEELQTLNARQHGITADEWHGFLTAFKVAREHQTSAGEARLAVLLVTVQTGVKQWPASSTPYEAELVSVLTEGTPNNSSLVVNPDPTPTLTLTPVREEPTSTKRPTEVQLVQATATPAILVQVTATRTPTPSRTPTLSPMPSLTPTPLTPLPSPTATYTRLPLLATSQVIVIPTQPNTSVGPVITGPSSGPDLPPNLGSGNPAEPTDLLGTVDPDIRPTLRSVYETQTAIAAGVEKSSTPDAP